MISFALYYSSSRFNWSDSIVQICRALFRSCLREDGAWALTVGVSVNSTNATKDKCYIFLFELSDIFGMKVILSCFFNYEVVIARVLVKIQIRCLTKLQAS